MIRYKIGKFLLVQNKIQLGFSSKIEMLQLGSAQLGKFQLELITTIYIVSGTQSSLLSNALTETPISNEL